MKKAKQGAVPDSEEKSVEANRKALGVLCAAASRHHFDNYF